MGGQSRQPDGVWNGDKEGEAESGDLAVPSINLAGVLNFSCLVPYF